MRFQTWVKEAFGDGNPVESEYQPVTVYYRISRPVINGSFYRAIPQEKLTGSFVALRILLNKLREIENADPEGGEMSTRIVNLFERVMPRRSHRI